MDETPLDGGLMNEGVTRVGDTVRRHMSPWSPTVHRLMAHARDAGVSWVPRVHGIDEQGREVLDFIAGEVGHGDIAAPDMGWLRAPSVLTDVARALREWHDATATFPRGPDDAWFFPGHPPFEVIGHNDFAPYNHVFREGRFVGAIDFDICYPASRAWDAAWTAYRYAPLTPAPGDAVDDGGSWADRSPFPRAEARARLDAFCAAYDERGPSTLGGPDGVLAVLPARLDAVAAWCETDAPADHRRWGKMYRAHARWIESGAFAAS